MCGRFTIRTNMNRLLLEFGAEARGLETVPRYNVAPTQQILILKGGQISLAKWGLIPSWAKDAKIGNSLINARAETVAEKPAFRSAFKRGRCCVIADGFYEWKKLDGKNKQPYFIHMKDDRPFAFAGLSERWKNGEDVVESATIVTTEANSLMSEIHDRMPVILPPEARQLWLDPEFEGKEQLLALLKPYLEEEMVATGAGHAQ